MNKVKQSEDLYTCSTYHITCYHRWQSWSRQRHTARQILSATVSRKSHAWKLIVWPSRLASPFQTYRLTVKLRLVSQSAARDYSSGCQCRHRCGVYCNVSHAGVACVYWPFFLQRCAPLPNLSEAILQIARISWC